MARLLFVDDDPFTLETLTKAAQLLGHEPLVAGTGQRAVALATKEIPDLIFTDVQLPDTDGFSLVHRLKEQAATNHIPMFILSASPAVDALECADIVGAEGYLNKPIRLQTLMDIIAKYIAE